MSTDNRKPYEAPRITHVKLEDKPVVAQTACKDSIDTDACAQIIVDDINQEVKRLPAFDLSPS
ncbi:MAG TPA: hypothetical protein PKE12_13465 [Kiritimatiellia bacterium]|nr:hypothetical protein [Kiritimatiellia bacterium]